jgi:hypothetical protein
MEAPVNRSPQSSVVSTNTVTDADVAIKSAVLEKFTSLLGTKSHESGVPTTGRMKEIASLLAPTTRHDEIVLIIPSLDLRLTDGEHGKNEVLPQMGEHARSLESDGSTSVTPPGGVSRPNMAASVLSLASDNVDVIEPMSAKNIGKQTSWTLSTLGYAAGAVGTNVTESFTTLLNSRLRAWTLLLLRHSLSTGSGESRSKLLSMLAANIQVKSVESKYRTLPLPEAAKGARPKDSDIILPLLFEVSLHISIQEKPEKVTLRAPGTISGKTIVHSLILFLYRLWYRFHSALTCGCSGAQLFLTKSMVRV